MTYVQPILSERLKRLNLSGNNITRLSFILSLITVEELDLSDNNIKELEDDTFSTLSYLIRLDLSKNYLKSLKEKSFGGLNRLQIVDLSHNLLQSITPGTFQYLNNLVWLNLADNKDMGKLDSIEDTSILLGAGQKLQTVDVSRTNLTKIPNTLTRSIRNLYISCNRISMIRCGDLDSFLLLQFLDLTSNNIEIIEDDALGRLELLFYLLLAENSLKSIPHSLPDNLLVLDLDHNRIQNVSANDFLGLSKLRTIRLAWNQIQVIHDSAFGQLSSLKNLDLSGNPLKILSSSTFIGPRRLINLSLGSLTSLIPTKGTLAFPVPESSHLQVLNLDNSPVLVNQLMEDVAALSTFRQINVLNLACSNITSIRSDLVNFFPRLQVLDLRGNKFNCTDIIWLSKWLRRIKSETSDETKLQSLEERNPLSNNTDFDIAQDVNAYINRLKSTSKEDGPKCATPSHLAGVSLYELSSGPSLTTTATTHQQSRYDQPNFNTRTINDHEFYQNDFPSPVNESKIKHETTQIINKFNENDKKHIKRSNTTGVSLRSVILPINESNFAPLMKPITEKSENNFQTTDNYKFTTVKTEGMKAEYLRSEVKYIVTTTTKSKIATDNDRSEKNKYESILESRDTSTDSSKQTTKNEAVISIYSPLGVSVHEIINDKKVNTEKTRNDDNTQSVSSPQKITVDEDRDVTKELLDKENEDLNETRYTHHPGLIVFLVATALLGITALVMRASQRHQSRHGYAQQQDIEVRSLDLSAQELW
ncbi:uncharacterized protein LOC142330389 [Lycorma delicatula]|uniref:uncharacterized protein LOC142330389 n=1 Tax=Lycorma delicatula TaxID=130591 RepID=UPI003F517C37